MCLMCSIGMSGIIILAYCFYLSSSIYAENQNDPLFMPDSSPYGKPYKYWAQKWWEWNLAFNSSSHPNNNYTDEKCALGQSADSPVWFLVQPWPEPNVPFERTCTIPHGKAIITATQAGDCNYGNLATKTDESLIDCATIGNDNTQIDFVTVDNKTYEKYEIGNRVLSDFFNISIKDDNIMEYPNIGTWRAVVDGYYIFLKPLDPGKHVLSYSYVTNPTDPSLQEYKTGQKGTWNLIIK